MFLLLMLNKKTRKQNTLNSISKLVLCDSQFKECFKASAKHKKVYKTRLNFFTEIEF